MVASVRIGDVVEIPTPRGLAYAQYTHEHPRFESVLRVLPGLHVSRPASLAPLVKQRHAYVVLLPLLATEVEAGAFAVVGHEEIPEDARAFPLFRAAGLALPGTGEVRSWWLWDGEREWRIGPLAPEHHDLPIREAPSTTLFVRRLAEGWRPRDDLGRGRDPSASPPSAVPPVPADRPLQHFLTFPERAAAEGAAAMLSAVGFTVTVRPGPSEAEWYVHAEQSPLPENVGAMRAQLEEVARRFGGSYDGWELYVGS